MRSTTARSRSSRCTARASSRGTGSVPTLLELGALDIDSRLATATLTSLPTQGSLHRAPRAATGATIATTPLSQLGLPLRVGTTLRRADWALVYVSDARVTRSAPAAPPLPDAPPLPAGVELLRTDRIGFTACDEEGACSQPRDEPTMQLRILNPLVGRRSSTTLLEDSPAEIQLRGGDMRGGAVSYALSSTPSHGSLHQCTPAPTPPPPATPPTSLSLAPLPNHHRHHPPHARAVAVRRAAVSTRPVAPPHGRRRAAAARAAVLSTRQLPGPAPAPGRCGHVARPPISLRASR